MEKCSVTGMRPRGVVEGMEVVQKTHWTRAEEHMADETERSEIPVAV